MHWMVRWAGGFPLFVTGGEGAYLTDVDGHRYLDLCLGDTGAMTGHAPAATVEAVRAQAGRGFTFMLPTEDAVWVGEELARRFGLPYWQFAVTATDANRFAIRLARADHRPAEDPGLQLVLSRHRGRDLRRRSSDGRAVPRDGNLGPPVDPALTTRVVEFNDLPALEAALAPGDVACVLAEPALTNVGIVHPEPGFHAGAPRADPPGRDAAHHRRDPHHLRRARAATPGLTASSPTCSPSGSRWPAACRARCTDSARRWRSGSRRGAGSRPRTPAGSAGRSRPTRSPPPRCGPPSSTC